MAKPGLRHRCKLSPCPHNCPPVMTLTFREPKGAWDGVRVAIQMSLAHKALESWVLLEELCIDIACGLVHHVLFSDPEEGLGRVLWFPQRTAPVLVQPHCHRQWPCGRLVLEAGWVLCLQISVCSPVFPGTQGDCRQDSEEVSLHVKVKD